MEYKFKYVVEHSDEKYIQKLSESMTKFYPFGQKHVVKRENGKVWMEIETACSYTFLWCSILDYLSAAKDYWPHNFVTPKVTEI